MKTFFVTTLLLLTGFSHAFSSPTYIQPAKPGGVCAACAIPTGLSASNQTGTTALLSWGAVAEAGSYNIEVENASGNPTIFVVKATIATTSYTVSGLLPNLNYKFKLRSKCGGDKSDWSSWATFNSSNAGTGGGGTGGGSGGGGGSCSTPSGMVLASITATTATLGWSAVPGVSGYRINIENASGNPFPLNFTVNLPSTATNYTVTGLVPGRAYKWKVRSLCGSQTSTWSPKKNFTTPMAIIGGNGAITTNGQPDQMADLTAYPNPTTGELIVAFAGTDGTVSITVVNLLGKTVLTAVAAANEQALLDLSALPPGMYLLAAQNGDLVRTQRISLNK